MAVELVGPALGPYAAISCITSFLMTGHRSVFPSQLLATTKSSSILVTKGSEMKDMPEVEFKLRSKSVTCGIVRGYDKAKKGLKKTIIRKK